MNVKIVFDFHDIFVDAKSAWQESFRKMTNSHEIVELYNNGMSKKEICKKYEIDYMEVEKQYREILRPIEKNIKFAQNISKIYPITIVSMAREERLLKDIERFNLSSIFNEVYSKEQIKDRGNFLNQLSQEYDWLVFFNHELSEIKIDEKVIYLPIDFEGDINQFEKVSFTEHAKNKLIYNELSDIYLESIANDTGEESWFLDNIFKKYHKDKYVLDCCCGVGRHCRTLAEKGYNVTGIDISKKQIENAKKLNGVKNVTYFNMDVRDIQLKNKEYDAGMCMWTTYNYLSEDKDFQKFIKGIHCHLNDNGVFILDAKNIPALETNRIYKRKNTSKNLDLELLVCKRIVGNVQNSQYFYFMKRNGKNEFYIDEEFVRFYYLEEIRELVKGYFEIVEVFGDFDMSTYVEKSSRRFIVVLKKVNKEIK